METPHPFGGTLWLELLGRTASARWPSGLVLRLLTVFLGSGGSLCRVPSGSRVFIDAYHRLRRGRLSAGQAALVNAPRAQGLLRYRGLGGDAVYRAVDVRGELVVDLEVVDAPGLACGTPMRVTRAAANRMTRVCRLRTVPRSSSGQPGAIMSR
jgi:hypothetical protein